MKKTIVFLSLLILLFSCKNDDKKLEHNATKKVELIVPEQIQLLINQSKKDTTNIDLQLKISQAFDSVKMYKQALVYLDKVIATDSLNNDYWLRRGRICKNLPDTAAAIKAFTYAEKIYPTPITLQELANLLAETRNPITINVCNKLIQMNPSGDYNAQAYFFMGVYFSKINDKQKAVTLFDKSINQDFHFADAYIEKGFIYFTNKEYKKALQVYEQLNAVNPTNADGYYWQAKCNEILSNKTKAIQLYKKAIQLDGTITQANEALQRLETKN